jgi:hypothetical protein
MNTKINYEKTVAIDVGYFWQPLDTAPSGVKVQLLTKFGIAVYGQYRKGDRDYVGWAPLPKIPDEIKGLMK